MAAAPRAFRRHLTWTLITAFLAAAILTGCNGDDDPPASAPAPPPGATYEPPPTTSPPSDATVLNELGRVSRSWLSGFGSPSTPDQGCSGPNSGWT